MPDLSDVAQGRLQVLVGAEPLIGSRTGIGHYTSELFHGLAQHKDVMVYAYAHRRLCEQPPFIPDAAAQRGRSGWRRLRARLLGSALGMMRLRGWVEPRKNLLGLLRAFEGLPARLQTAYRLKAIPPRCG